MSANTALLMKKIHEADRQFGSSDNWPKEVAAEIKQIANGSDNVGRANLTAEMRELIVRGFTTSAIVNKVDRSRSWVQAKSRAVMTKPGFKFEGTFDDLEELRDKMNRLHGTYQVAKVMNRRPEWVSAMVKRLD